MSIKKTLISGCAGTVLLVGIVAFIGKCLASIIISPVASTKNVTINVTFNHVNSKPGPMGPKNRIFQAV